jgi:DnaK suppressor protein
MNHEVARKFRTLFEEQKKNMISSRSLIDQGLAVNPDDLADEADLTSSELEASMRMRLRNRETLYLKKIDEALKRIAEGTFGHCESCEEEIEMRRLEARPTTTLCLGCKEEEERRETLHIDGHQHKSLGRRLKLA